MRHCSRHRLALACAVLGLLLLGGCGGRKGPTVKGTVVLPPSITLGNSDVLTVTFLPEGQAEKGFNALSQPGSDSFVAKGPLGQNAGVPPGKYRLAVKIDSYGGPESPKKSQIQQLNATYDTAHTKLSYDVTPKGQQSIVVDLVKGTVTAE